MEITINTPAPAPECSIYYRSSREQRGSRGRADGSVGHMPGRDSITFLEGVPIWKGHVPLTIISSSNPHLITFFNVIFLIAYNFQCTVRQQNFWKFLILRLSKADGMESFEWNY